MSQRAPAVVGLYLRESGRWRRIAEFRLNSDGRASFRAVDPVEGLVARVWYHQGVDLLGQERTVLPADGAEFLRALLQPFGFRDYRFRDDSRPGRAANGLPRTGGGRTRIGNGLPHTGHAALPHDTGGAAADSDCAHGTHRPSRPAAWRALDEDVIRF
ncbi:hypothetical protein [Nocardia sp. NPDC056100]|uniref:hypothetical protein n=1 Tax=Nocardia sp. NPDC056100 TaxID=3345712 RepID=UPI0035D6F3A1